MSQNVIQNQSLLKHTSLEHILQQKHHNTNLVFEGASYLGIIFANNKPPLALSASAAKKGKLACNQLKKRTCCS
jgi:hypothetical protein